MCNWRVSVKMPDKTLYSENNFDEASKNMLSLSEQQFLEEVKSIIHSGQQSAVAAVNRAAVLTYWNIGKRIVEQE